MQDYTNSVKDILVQLSNTLIHSLKELMEIQSLVIQNKAFIQSDVSRIIYGIFSCSCSQWLSFWTSFLEGKPMFMQRNVEIICLWDNLDFSLFECHCLRQFGLYGYFMWILDFARFMKLTSEESPPFTTDIDVIVFYLWYLRNVLIEWHIWILFSSWWFLYKWLGGGTNQLKKERKKIFQQE